MIHKTLSTTNNTTAVMGPELMVLDTECVPFQVDKYFEYFPESDKIPGLDSVVSEVVCVGLLRMDQTEGEDKFIIIDHSNLDTEKNILQFLYNVLLNQIENNYSNYLITYNGRKYDIPMLYARAIRYRIPLPMILPKYNSPYHIDLYADHYKGQWGKSVSSRTLEECMYDVFDEPPDKFSGKDVARLYQEGELAAISEHCKHDLEKTARIFRHLEGVAI